MEDFLFQDLLGIFLTNKQLVKDLHGRFVCNINCFKNELNIYHKSVFLLLKGCFIMGNGRFIMRKYGNFLGTYWSPKGKTIRG